MPDDRPRLPPVFLPTRGKNRDLEYAIAYLILKPDGSTWAYPDDLAHQQAFDLADAYLLDQAHLQLHPSSRTGREVYLYGQVVDADPIRFHRLPRFDRSRE
jgi:hypothetical protein